MQKHSFTLTLCAKIKHGRQKKGGASTANAKKEHHHGEAVCHGILAHHPHCHRHCPLCCCCHCSPTNLVTVSIALPPSPSLSLATLITATGVAAIALIVTRPAPLSSSLLATLIAATVVAAAIAFVVARPAPLLPLPSLLPSLPVPSSSLATLVTIVIALFVASAFTCLPPSLPTGIILLTNQWRWRRWWQWRGADCGGSGGVGNTATK
jgi:hypothetical protein